MIVSLSYHDAGRWLDAQETVEQVPAPADVIDWMREFAEAHHTPEPKRRQRPQSFQGLQDRFGNPAAVSTEKKFGGGGGHERCRTARRREAPLGGSAVRKVASVGGE